MRVFWKKHKVAFTLLVMLVLARIGIAPVTNKTNLEQWQKVMLIGLWLLAAADCSFGLLLGSSAIMSR